MKKLVLLFLSVAFLMACNQSSDNAKTEEQAEHSHTEATELSLNNGAKWKSDSSTNHNVSNLENIASSFKIKSSPSTNDYQKLSKDLGNGLNKMIQECKMSGPDHDALHQWLEPILAETNQLKTTADTAAAVVSFKSIDERIEAYHTYFE